MGRCAIKLRATGLCKMTAHLVIFALLLCGAPIWKFTQGSVLSDFLAKGLLLFCGCLGAVTIPRMKIDGKFLVVLAALEAYLLMYILVTGVNTSSFLLSFMLVFAVLFFYSYSLQYNHRFAIVLDAYSNVIVFLGTVSLILWFLGSVLHILPSNGTVRFYWAESWRTASSYFGLYYEIPGQAVWIGGQRMIRNCGIFSEAPGFSSYLMYATALDVLVLQKKWNSPKVLLLVLTTLSTFSTKSLIGLIVIFLLRYLSDGKYGSKAMLAGKLVFSAIAVGLGAIACYWVLESKANTASLLIRMDDVWAALKAWGENPIFGVGFHNHKEIVGFFTVNRSNSGLSMGLTVLLAIGGVYLAAFYFGAFLVSVGCRKGARKEILLFAVVVLMNLVISNVAFDPATLFLVASGYAAAARPKCHPRGQGKEGSG